MIHSLKYQQHQCLIAIDDEKIIQVALGAEHSLVLTESGKCFVGGLYCYGQFGTRTNLVNFKIQQQKHLNIFIHCHM
jgi:alpha-tubulin suppressor-like RCC1 family protein